MNELALFAGAGGGILGGKLLGWRTVCAVEFNSYAASVLAQRQNDGLLPPFPIWDDVCTFDGRPWQGIVDVVSGGFPCQDISAAGKGAGISGERSGLWGEMARIIGEVRPRYAFVENSPILTSRGLDRVLGDLAALGYDAEWGVLGAADVGAPHKRERIWIIANASKHLRDARRPESAGQQRTARSADGGNEVADTDEEGLQGRCRLEQKNKGRETTPRIGQDFAGYGGGYWWAVEPNVGRVADGVAARVDRLTAIGNGQVPQCAAEAFRRLISR